MILHTVDRAKPQKLYCQLLEILKKQIGEGEWRVGTRIPTEEQLCSQYNVSRATVRLAVEELVDLGYLKRFQGKGTFVRRRNPDNSVAMLIHLGDNDISQSFPCVTRVIETASLLTDISIKMHLRLSEEDHCFRIVRLTIADGTPLVLQKLYISYGAMSCMPYDSEVAGSSAHVILENSCSIKIQRIKEMIDVSPAGGQDAALLELISPAPVLRTRHIYYASGDVPVGFSDSLHRTDSHPRVSVLERLRI